MLLQKYVPRVAPYAAALWLAACAPVKSPTFTQVPDEAPRTAVIGFYNTENLFDTQDDPATNDQDFLPTSDLKWDDVRYRAKLSNLASVIEQLGSPNGPDVLGLSEVENQKVLNDLVNTSALQARKYKIIHFESPDPRGIDVALLYKADRFTPTAQRAIPVPLPDTVMGTRDLLFVQGKLNGEPITFIVNHWPSRRGGQEKARYAVSPWPIRCGSWLMSSNALIRWPACC